MHLEPESKIFGTLGNPCIYNLAIFITLAYLEPEASSKSSQTCKMIMHIYLEPWRSQNCLFECFQGYFGIFRDIDGNGSTTK